MDSAFFIKLVQFILSLSLLVLLHEGGHFFFSKIFGVRVNRFYIFFNPKFHLFSTYDKWFRKLMKKEPVEVPDDEPLITTALNPADGSPEEVPLRSVKTKMVGLDYSDVALLLTQYKGAMNRFAGECL